MYSDNPNRKTFSTSSLPIDEEEIIETRPFEPKKGEKKSVFTTMFKKIKSLAMYSDNPNRKTFSPKNSTSSLSLEEEEIIEESSELEEEEIIEESSEFEAQVDEFINNFNQRIEFEELQRHESILRNKEMIQGSNRSLTDNSNNDPGARDGEQKLLVESNDANVLVDSFKVKLIESVSPLEGEMFTGSSSTSFFGRECCIYRVEEKFHELSHRAYIPDMVSIGPFHRGKGCLLAMEQYKLFYLRNLLTRMTTTTIEWSSILEEWVESMKSIEEEARECYSEPINLSSNEFVKMMLVDGLFIIELFRKKAGEVKIDRDDPLFDNTTCNLSTLVHDLVLLENQLPMLVLNHLFNLPKLHNELRDSSNITTLALIFFDLLMPKGKRVLNTDYEGKHLLDLLHKTFLNALPRPFATENNSWKSIPSATKLKCAGIKFKTGSTEGNFLDIKFTDGILEVPPISIHDQTATLLRNLIAFEQCSGRNDTYITSYAALMKSILNSTSDVGFLRNQGIITNYLGDDEDFSNIFIELSSGINTLCNFYYSELCDQVNTHYEKTLWHVWGATLRPRDYLCKYVTGLAVLVFALILGKIFKSSISKKGSFVGGPNFMACALSGLAGAFFALLASRMTNKVWSFIRTGENIVERESQSGDGQYSDQGFLEAVLSDHSEDAISSRASTPQGDIPPSPIRVPSKASPGFLETVISDHSKGAISSGASKPGGDIPSSPIRVPSKGSPDFSETVLSDLLEDATSIGIDSFDYDISWETDSFDHDILWEDLTIGKEIEKGLKASVYRGLWRGLDVEVKVFSEFYLANPKAFEREVLLTKRLHHPNVGRFLGAVTSPKHLCIVTEFLSRNDGVGKLRVRVAGTRIAGGNMEIPPDDGYTWRKYGQKEILGSTFPRGYYRCTHWTSYGCIARKQVHRLDEDPNTFEVTYYGHHTCHISSSAAAAYMGGSSGINTSGGGPGSTASYVVPGGHDTNSSEEIIMETPYENENELKF